MAHLLWLIGQADDIGSKLQVIWLSLKLALAKRFGLAWKSGGMISLNMAGNKIWMRTADAPSLTEIYSDIFRGEYGAHPAFIPREGDTILDLGANIGLYSLWARRTNKSGKMISVEASPLSFEILEKNIKTNGLINVTAIGKAVLDRSGSTQFEVVPDVSAIGAVNIRDQQRPWLADKRIKRLRVPATTIDEIVRKAKLKRIDMIKMDIEASELAALKGAKRTLKNTRGLVIEFHGAELKKEVIEFLRKCGFKLVLKVRQENVGYFTK
jgi:FkbM family methyltransferase